MRPLSALAIAWLLTPAVSGAASHYERHHPDVFFREQGLAQLDAGDAKGSMQQFMEAARYADKPSQAMIAEAYAQGRGVPRDPVLAYVWMDLAAERGYPLFVAKRETLWQALTPAQQSTVVAAGLPVYADFGDEVAKPRLERLLRAGKRDAPGSRVGAGTAFVDVYTNITRGSRDYFNGTPTPGYYQPRYWNASAYWEAMDRDWSRMPTGIVEVKPLTPGK